MNSVFKARLERIADSLPAKGLSSAKTLPFDSYLLRSGLQKAVRRGNVELTSRFALSLWHTDKRSLWRRLAIIAVEDVGVGCMDVTLDVLLAYASNDWRTASGDVKIAIHLAQQMAKAPKTRLLRELFVYSDRSEVATFARGRTEEVSLKKLRATLLDNEKETFERILALWGLGGKSSFSTEVFSGGQGNVEEAIIAIKRLPIPDEIIQVCLTALKLPHWPLASLLPLGWLEMKKQGKDLYISKEMPLSAPECTGLPTWAMDGLYTRSGKQSIRSLQAAVPCLKSFTAMQIGEGYFFIESEPLNLRLTSRAWEDLRQEYIFTVMAGLGLNRNDYMVLRRILIKNLDLYNDIRLKKIETLAPKRLI